jgi:hypothetical protein
MITYVEYAGMHGDRTIHIVDIAHMLSSAGEGAGASFAMPDGVILLSPPDWLNSGSLLVNSRENGLTEAWVLRVRGEVHR